MFVEDYDPTRNLFINHVTVLLHMPAIENAEEEHESNKCIILEKVDIQHLLWKCRKSISPHFIKTLLIVQEH